MMRKTMISLDALQRLLLLEEASFHSSRLHFSWIVFVTREVRIITEIWFFCSCALRKFADFHSNGNYTRPANNTGEWAICTCSLRITITYRMLIIHLSHPLFESFTSLPTHVGEFSFIAYSKWPMIILSLVTAVLDMGFLHGRCSVDCDSYSILVIW
jgi:hypothetical protein